MIKNRPMTCKNFAVSQQQNQSVESTGVAFVKGANNYKEKNTKFMTNKPKDEQAQGRTDLGMNTVK